MLQDGDHEDVDAVADYVDRRRGRSERGGGGCTEHGVGLGDV
jgi:hypothetical protein